MHIYLVYDGILLIALLPFGLLCEVIVTNS